LLWRSREGYIKPLDLAGLESFIPLSNPEIQKFQKFQKFCRPVYLVKTPRPSIKYQRCHPVVIKAVAARAAVEVRAAVGRVEVGRALAIFLLLRLQ
jgi:hypothetical protein